MIFSLFFVTSIAHATSGNASIPADNDETYTIPTYIPKVSIAKRPKKIIFEDDGFDNDAVYMMPKDLPKKIFPKKAEKKKEKKSATSSEPVADSQPVYQEQYAPPDNQYYDPNQYYYPPAQPSYQPPQPQQYQQPDYYGAPQQQYDPYYSPDPYRNVDPAQPGDTEPYPNYYY